MDFIASKNFSLLCAGINGCFAVGALAEQNWILLVLSSIFFVVCVNNYRAAPE